jgi:hypothetical protein
MNEVIIKPILKNPKGKVDEINNLRPISISNTLAQLFERFFLYKINPALKNHKNQFGFKQRSSCTLALFTMRETILNYIENNSCLYLVSLDAEKAFDKLWREGLFFKLAQTIDKHSWLL